MNAGSIGAIGVSLLSLLQPLSPGSGPPPLTAVRDLVASVSGDTATVTWQPPASGSVARYQVQALLGGLYGSDYGTRIVSGTSITWDRLPFNQQVAFTVTPVGPDGAAYTSGPTGPVNETGVVTAADSYCPAGGTADCVVIDPAEDQGPETRPGAGLLEGTVPPGNPYAPMLQLTHWRVLAGNTNQSYDASAYVSSENMIQDLSGAWYAATNYTASGVTYAADPWANWTTYSNFVQAVVHQVEAAGQNPYWEIQNEPENYPYSPNQPPSRYLVQQQYLYAYRAIKAADPNARVVGPSIDWYYQNLTPGWYIDMKSFVPFAAANGMQLSAISWHDNYDAADGFPLNYSETPQWIRDQAAEVRELVAENPGIGSPLLFVDENSSAAGQFSPGWEAGYLSEDDRAGITWAGRACWSYPADTTPALANTDCAGPYLDQLLNQDGIPNSSFWTMVDYAAMAGHRVWSESNDTDVSNLAVTDTSGTTRILLGRHQTCSGWTATSRYCAAMSPPAAVPTAVNVLVPSGATSATVTVQEIADSVADEPATPASTTTTTPVAGGAVPVALPAFQDGEAYFVTVTPNQVSGTFGPDGTLTSGEVPPASGPSAPTRLLVEGGNYQSAVVLHQYGAPLTVLLTDQYGNPLSNQLVTFLVPSGYGSFGGGGNNATVVTDGNGMATSPPLKAGIYAGGFTAVVYLTNLGPGSPRPTAYFALSNHL